MRALLSLPAIAAAAALGLAASIAAAPASAAGPALRLAAPSDCATNAYCAVGLRRYYGVEVRARVRKTPPADTFLALARGQAGIAVIFSTDPDIENAGIVFLRDDRGMLGAENIVPMASKRIADAYGDALRQRINRISAALATRDVRDVVRLNESGLTPRAAAESWLQGKGLAGEPALRAGPRILIGWQDFPENRVLAFIYARGLRGGGFNASVTGVNGFRDAAREALFTDRIGMTVEYASSALEFANGFAGFSSYDTTRVMTLLRGWMRQRGVTVYAPAKARSQNRFAVLRSTSKRYGLTKLSDLRKLGYRRFAASGRVPAIAAAAPADERLFAFGLGDRGPDVRSIQERLRTLGYLARTPDGRFDEATRRAVVAFQEDYRLAPDGVVGSLTFRRLRAALLGQVTPTPATKPGDPGTIAPPSTGKVIYLTFGGGPSEQWTPRILDALAANNAKATFLVQSAAATASSALIARAAAAGHAIGVSTFDYPNLSGGRLLSYRAELRGAIDAVRVATGKSTTCLRPAYGVINAPALRPTARALSLRLALWDIDTQDWTKPGAGVIANTILNNVRAGDIVRLEDGGGDRSQTVVALGRFLGSLRNQGFRFAALDCQPA